MAALNLHIAVKSNLKITILFYALHKILEGKKKTFLISKKVLILRQDGECRVYYSESEEEAF